MANRIASRISSGEKIAAPVNDKKTPVIDTTQGDDSVKSKSNWIRIGDKKVRSVHRLTKRFIKNKEGKTLPVFRKYANVEILSPNNELTTFQMSSGTGLRGISYKRYNPRQIELLHKLAMQLDMPMPKVGTIFNKTSEHIYQEIMNNPEMSSLKILKKPDIKKIQSTIKTEPKSKHEFFDDISRILNVTQDSAENLLSLITASKDIESVELEQKPELDQQELQKKDLNKIHGLIGMQKDILDEIKNATGSIEKNELYAQGIQIERKLKEFGISIDDSVENYHKPLRTGASWVDMKKQEPKILNPGSSIDKDDEKSTKSYSLTADDLIEYAKRRGIELSPEDALKKLEKLKIQDPDRLPTFRPIYSENIKELINLIEEFLR